jgi:hypothetical protein
MKAGLKRSVQSIAREVIRKIGYTKSEYMFEANSCGILSAIHEQSADINQGVDKKKKEEQGAGDQGMMFGYATNETANYMPLALDLSHALLIELANLRRENSEIKYLRPDAKSQVTLEYSDDNKPVRIDALQRALSKINETKPTERLQVLQNNLEITQNKKIALNTGDGITFIELLDILYLKADGSYTHFFLSNKNKIIVSKKIAEFERLEQVGNFMRIHRSHVINLERIQKILKQDGGTVIMDNGDELSISSDKKSVLLEKFDSFRF